MSEDVFSAAMSPPGSGGINTYGMRTMAGNKYKKPRFGESTVTNPPDPGGVRVHLPMGYQNEDGRSDYTEAERIEFAKRFDRMVVQSKSNTAPIFTPAMIAQMKSINPKFEMYVYVNAGLRPQNAGHPEAWYAHTSTTATEATRVTNAGSIWIPRDMMQPSNTEWRAWAAQEFGNRVFSQSTYDGIFIDVLGLPADYPKPVVPTGGLTYTPEGGGPVTLAAGTVFNKSTWVEFTKFVGADIRAMARTINPAAKVFANGLKYGVPYLTDQYRLLTAPTNALDGGLSEQWTRAAHDTTTRTTAALVKDLQMHADIVSRGKTMIAMSKDWNVPPNIELMKFGFYWFLLTDNGTGTIAVSASQATTMNAYDWFNYTNYGVPTGPYTVVGGSYQRVMTRCVVVCNPDPVASWSGTVAGQVVNLGPHRGTAVFT